MQEKFKTDEDEPPFNFQAMLRKTNTKRESLRRSDGFNNNFQNPAAFNNRNSNNVLYQSKANAYESKGNAYESKAKPYESKNNAYESKGNVYPPRAKGRS